MPNAEAITGVDLHADGAAGSGELRRRRSSSRRCYAVGLDPTCDVVRPAMCTNTRAGVVMECTCRTATERMTQFKDKSKKAIRRALLPTRAAADISSTTPKSTVGDDQRSTRLSVTSRAFNSAMPDVHGASRDRLAGAR